MSTGAKLGQHFFANSQFKEFHRFNVG